MTFSTTIKKAWWEKKLKQYKQKGYFYEAKSAADGEEGEREKKK